MSKLLARGSDWTFPLLEKLDHTIGDIACNGFGLDCYPNQIEVIASEQMLDAYASLGLPIHYPHWSFGKAFIGHEQNYKRGHAGLAYEIVINSNPCISYLMEENTLAMQALVIAHAAYGHNSFFKGNYLFRQWTQADAIIDYMVFARRYVMNCEERYGPGPVEAVLDAAHALMHHGVDRYHHPRPLSADAEAERQAERARHDWANFDDIWRTLPKGKQQRAQNPSARGEQIPAEPQENLLYFIEKHAPALEPWQRELVRIVRKLAQYFYPQGQTKVMNEGWASFWHYTLMNSLYDRGFVDDGCLMEVLANHTNVVFQPPFDDPRYSGINPYALGFGIFRELRRICEKPTREDQHFFPDIAGGDWRKVLDFAMRQFKDESFIAQFLSPHLMRELHLFAIADHRDDQEYLHVDAIHNDQGYRRLRGLLARQYARESMVPDIQITRFDVKGDRSLTLTYQQRRGRPLNDEAETVMGHLQSLWGYPVILETRDEDGNLVVDTPEDIASEEEDEDTQTIIIRP